MHESKPYPRNPVVSAEDLKRVPRAFEPGLLSFSCKTPPVSSKAFDQAVVLTAHLQNICQVGRDGEQWGGGKLDMDDLHNVHTCARTWKEHHKLQNNSVFLSKEIQV